MCMDPFFLVKSLPMSDYSVTKQYLERKRWYYTHAAWKWSSVWKTSTRRRSRFADIFLTVWTGLCSDTVCKQKTQNILICLLTNGITHEVILHFAPESSKNTERLNQTLLDMALPMLLYIPSRYRIMLWAKSINTKICVRNRLMRKALTKI